MLAPHRIGIAHRPSHTLRSQVMRPKDPLPIQDRSDVVYKIPCGECPAHYVGETSKCVASRIKEHKLAIKRGEPHSQLWAHIMGTGHNFNFGDVEVVASDNTKGGRLIKEAWLTNQTSINRCVDLCQAHIALRTWEERRHQRYRARYHTEVIQRTVTHTPPPRDDPPPECRLDKYDRLAIEDNNWHPPEGLLSRLDPLNTNNDVAIGYGQNSTTSSHRRRSTPSPPPLFPPTNPRGDSNNHDSMGNQLLETETIGLGQRIGSTTPERGAARSEHPPKASPCDNTNNQIEPSRRGEERRGARTRTRLRHPPETPPYNRDNIQTGLLRREDERGGARTRAWTSRSKEGVQRQTDLTTLAQPQPMLDKRSPSNREQTNRDIDSLHPLRGGKERRGANTRAWMNCIGEYERRQTDPMAPIQIGKGRRHDPKHPAIPPCLSNNGKNSSAYQSSPPTHLTLDPRSQLDRERTGEDAESPYQTENSSRTDGLVPLPPAPRYISYRSAESGTGVKTRSQTKRLNMERTDPNTDKRGVGSSKNRKTTSKQGNDTELRLAHGQLDPSNPNCNNPIPSSPRTYSQQHDASKARLDQGVDYNHIRLVKQCEIMDSALCARVGKDTSCSGAGEFNDDHIPPISSIETPVRRSRPMTRAFLRAQCELRYKTSLSQRPLRP